MLYQSYLFSSRVPFLIGTSSVLRVGCKISFIFSSRPFGSTLTRRSLLTFYLDFGNSYPVYELCSSFYFLYMFIYRSLCNRRRHFFPVDLTSMLKTRKPQVYPFVTSSFRLVVLLLHPSTGSIEHFLSKRQVKKLYDVKL